MYIKLREHLLRKIMEKAFRRAGNIRKLEKILNIPRSTLSSYHQEARHIKTENLNKIKKYLKIKIKEGDLIENLPDNWKQIIGGLNCVKKKKQNGTFERQIIEAREKAKKGSIKWHRKMKENNPKKY